MSSSSLADALREGVRGPVLTDESSLERYSFDFGNLRRRLPLAVVRSQSEQDVVHTLRVARSFGVPVSSRGAGHSVGGQCLCEGIVLAHDAEAGEVRVLEDGRAEVTCRSRWKRVERTLAGAGRMFPILTNLLRTSVGGTLSVGGYGVRSFVDGAQVDQVERARLILPEGQAVWCSREENPELFRFALAGFGQVGVLERVVLRTLPDRPIARLQMNRHRNWREMVDSLAWTAEWEGPGPELFFAEHRAGKLWSIFGTQFETDAAAQASSLPEPLVRMARERVHMVANVDMLHKGEDEGELFDPAMYRVMGDYCLDLEGLRRFVAFLEEQPSRFWLPNLDLVRLLGLAQPKDGGRWPFDIRAAYGGPQRVYGIGLYYLGPLSDQAGLEAARQAHRACMEKCLELGGRPYLYGWMELDRDARQALYKQDYTRMRALRQELDPRGLLNPESL
ncbi:FAD-binding oxidoreductase [Archangium violaceum]|uniref:FAD-binding oxidoreductase n=1 Tax=Archangium violaceum TaxID=83451 RepID=UPI00193C1C2C|nr:FAD-binding oxidoreductase [Archangium violaceum]QRK06009.1 FAD-binding oxidoreductase [Archangium violaceum]